MKVGYCCSFDKPKNKAGCNQPLALVMPNRSQPTPVPKEQEYPSEVPNASEPDYSVQSQNNIGVVSITG
jgi:hypothetical protein